MVGVNRLLIITHRFHVSDSGDEDIENRMFNPQPLEYNMEISGELGQNKIVVGGHIPP